MHPHHLVAFEALILPLHTTVLESIQYPTFFTGAAITTASRRASRAERDLTSPDSSCSAPVISLVISCYVIREYAEW